MQRQKNAAVLRGAVCHRTLLREQPHPLEATNATAALDTNTTTVTTTVTQSQQA
jgi:hypothetical protein